MFGTMPPCTQPTLVVMPCPASVRGMQRDDLARQRVDRTRTLRRIDAGVRRHPFHLERHHHRALAAGDEVAADAARLGVEHGAHAARHLHDALARGARADLLVAGEEQAQRRRLAAERASASATKTFITRPDFMSATPGP